MLSAGPSVGRSAELAKPLAVYLAMFNMYALATDWLSGSKLERRIVLLIFLCTLPSLAVGFRSDDYLLHRNLQQNGALEAYTFFPRDPDAAHARLEEQRDGGGMPWWADEYPRTSYFRPLSSLSLWLDFTSGLPAWWMHLENCVIYTALVWLAVALYRQLGLSHAGLGVAALFFALDGAVATSVGWISGRNSLLAACFGLACILFHARSQRAIAWLCFALSLLSGELGLCTLAYLAAYALSVERGSMMRRVLALLPYGLSTALYLTYYTAAGYGNSGAGILYQDFVSSQALAVLLSGLESLPIWLATTATLPIASLQLLGTDLRISLILFSLIVLTLLVPLVGCRALREPHGRMFTLGALLSLAPLAATLPQERLRFFVSFGVYGLLGPWVARDFGVSERLRRGAARVIWRLHGVLLPLLFVPCLFSIAAGPGVPGSVALDRELPGAHSPVVMLLNPPVWMVPWYQVAMRAFDGRPGPPVYTLYAGGQSPMIRRVDDRSFEMQLAHSWFSSPFERLRNLTHAPFHPGDRIALSELEVQVQEVDSIGAPTRVLFTFKRALEDPELVFRYWEGAEDTLWTPPAIGDHVHLRAAKAF